jgi:hypothetical protein
MTHKFRVGQFVRLATGRFADRSGAGIYQVVRLLPETNGEFGYRIKATNELTERAVREHEISPAGSN